MALLAPMHRASVAMAMAAKPGVFSSERRAYFRSENVGGRLAGYSLRSATNGSMRVARRAGIQQAQAATAQMSMEMPT